MNLQGEVSSINGSAYAICYAYQQAATDRCRHLTFKLCVRWGRSMRGRGWIDKAAEAAQSARERRCVGQQRQPSHSRIGHRGSVALAEYLLYFYSVLAQCMAVSYCENECNGKDRGAKQKYWPPRSCKIQQKISALSAAGTIGGNSHLLSRVSGLKKYWLPCSSCSSCHG